MTDAEARPAEDAAGTIRLKIRRQDRPDAPQTRRWEEFDVPRGPALTIASALARIDRNPVTAAGHHVAPVAREVSCLADACGACTVLVNGQPRQACTTRLEEVALRAKKPVVLEPLSKFPVIRDLIVDRSRMFDDEKRAGAWITVDRRVSRRHLPPVSTARQEMLEALSRCTGCGACLQACPQYGEHSEFIGAAALNQVHRSNHDPTGRHERVRRLEAVMGPGGVADCGKAQNCVEVCPVEVPLVDSIQSVSRDTSKHLLLGWLLG